MGINVGASDKFFKDAYLKNGKRIGYQINKTKCVKLVDEFSCIFVFPKKMYTLLGMGNL